MGEILGEMKRDEEHPRGIDLASTSAQQVIAYLLGRQSRQVVHFPTRSLLFINLTALYERRFPFTLRNDMKFPAI